MLPNDIAEYKENGQWNVLSEADARARMLLLLAEESSSELVNYCLANKDCNQH
jgi:hypothetical protein